MNDQAQEYRIHDSDQSILPLTVDKLSFQRAGKTLLDDLSFTLKADSCTLLMGANGAGKTLLMRLCHGLLTPSAGTVRWAQQKPHAQTMVFQKPVLLRRSVSANIDFALHVIGVPWRERKASIIAALKQAGLVALAKQPAHFLSGGEQQRLALVRAWATRPQVLFLDEPTASLDPASTQAIENLIHTIQRDGTKIIMATHDIGQAKRLGNEVMFLHRGKIVEHRPAKEFFAAPKSAAAQAFLEGRNYW